MYIHFVYLHYFIIHIYINKCNPPSSSQTIIYQLRSQAPIHTQCTHSRNKPIKHTCVTRNTHLSSSLCNQIELSALRPKQKCAHTIDDIGEHRVGEQDANQNRLELNAKKREVFLLLNALSWVVGIMSSYIVGEMDYLEHFVELRGQSGGQQYDDAARRQNGVEEEFVLAQTLHKWVTLGTRVTKHIVNPNIHVESS